MYDPVFVGDIANDPDNVPTAGLVPAPEHGDANRNFYISASGVWKAPSIFEPISMIKVPNGTTNIYLTKLGAYDVVRVTMSDTLPNTSNAFLKAFILNSGTTTWTGASVIYTQRVLTGYSAALVEGAADNGTGAYFTLGEHATTPNPANTSLQSPITSSSAYYLGSFIFNNFSDVVASKNVTTMTGSYSYESATGSIVTGFTSGYCAANLSGTRTGILFTLSTGTFYGGTILVEGVRYNAAYNNNFTTFT